MFDVIAFDADDTLWHSEILYAKAQDRFKSLLLAYLQGAAPHDADWIEQKLYQTEARNLRQYGYGIKGFALSMIEAAIELTEGRITGQDIQRIIDIAKDMLNADVELVEYARPTLARLSESHALMLITKGDLLDQERKLAQSGITPYFRYIEIVSDKTREAYQAILNKYQIAPSKFLMVGNSLKSDVLPVIALGGRAVYIPYHITWAHEAAIETESIEQGYYQLEHLGLLPALVEQISQAPRAPR
jgi:putative hydrolase of the HAD superfamily